MKIPGERNEERASSGREFVVYGMAEWPYSGPQWSYFYSIHPSTAHVPEITSVSVALADTPLMITTTIFFISKIFLAS